MTTDQVRSPFFADAGDATPSRAPAFDELLEHLCLTQGSDLHLKAGAVPHVRLDGRLTPTELPHLTEEVMEALATQVLRGQRATEFERTNEADVGVGIGGLGRFRVNVYRQRGSVAMVVRRVPTAIPSFESLALPDAVRALSEEARGLVLVTGPTGSGKTTTVAAMIDHINRTRAVNVVTIEDPIEFLFHDQMALVSQREIGTDTADFREAMRRVLRQDPDVIFIGEMRDQETVKAAMSAAETGHLVLSTLHTADAVETINRIVDFFPSDEHHQVRIGLAASLKGVVSQRLLERATGGGRVPAVEVLVNTGRVADRIADPDTGGDSIAEIVAEGEFYGMQSFDQSLFRLFKDGEVGLREAMAAASSPHDLRLALQRAGLVAARPDPGG